LNSFPYVSMSLPTPFSFVSSIEDMEERDVEDGDCLGVSFGEAAAVEGDDEAAIDEAVTVLCRTVRLGIAVEAILYTELYYVDN
jgi:hypothetical protein